MRVIVGMATFKGRENSVKEAVNSLSGQVDEIILYDNELNPNLTDNGKFYGLNILKEDCYYLSCDDDLIYPHDYAQTMIEAIERTKGIVTHHGRILLGERDSYYRGGHKTFRCLDYNGSECQIDVAGTGVSGWRTDYFDCKELAFEKYQKMSDIIFSREAAIQGKKITVLKHKQGWIKHTDIDLSKTIHATESRREETQTKLANEIWRLNYQSEQKI